MAISNEEFYGGAVFRGPVTATLATAAGHLVIKSQFDTGIADAKALGNATGTLDVANRVADASIALAKLIGLQTYVDGRITTLVDASSTALDTFREFAAAIDNNPNFSTTVIARFVSAENRLTALEAGGGSAPQKIMLPAIAGSPLTVPHSKGNREVQISVWRVSDNQQVRPVVKNGAAGSITVDFSDFTSAANTFYVLVT